MTDARDPLADAMREIWVAVTFDNITEAEELRRTRAILARHGLAVVPVEPTEAIILQGWLALPRLRPDTAWMRAAYRAMLAAAQEPQR